MKIGKPKYGNSRKKREYFKLKDGESTFRILPPMGDLADKGIWSMYYAVHFGYKDSEGRLRPFVSPLVKNNKTKMIEVPDAALDHLNKMKAAYEEAKRNGDSATVDRLARMVGGKDSEGKYVRGQYSLDKNHYMNVIDKHGNIGLLQVRYSAKKALDSEINALKEKGIDPLSIDDGRFFTFRRSGTGLDTSYKVSVAKESLQVEGVGTVERDIVHKLDDSIISRLKDEAVELDKLYKKPTAEEVARIVNEGPKAVDEILGSKSSNSDQEISKELAQEVSQEVSVSSGGSSNTLAKADPAVVQETKAVTQEAPKAEAQAQTEAEKIAQMSDEEFMKSLGL